MSAYSPEVKLAILFGVFSSVAAVITILLAACGLFSQLFGRVCCCLPPPDEENPSIAMACQTARDSVDSTGLTITATESLATTHGPQAQGLDTYNNAGTTPPVLYNGKGITNQLRQQRSDVSSLVIDPTCGPVSSTDDTAATGVVPADLDVGRHPVREKSDNVHGRG
jgi:hypothetical protein